MKVSNVSQMRKLDQTAIDTYGIADELLMENAGLAVFEVIREKIGVRGKRILIFSGAGNNGGDGFVVARKIHAGGGRARVAVLGNPEKYRGAARLNWEIANRLPIEITPVDSIADLARELTHCDAVVDAIFGTGLTRNVEGIYAETIRTINQSGRPVISVDIPSGVHGDTGRIMGVAIKADDTVTFGLPKYGNLLYPGFSHNGHLFVTHISFPPAMYDTDAIKVEVNAPPPLPDRNPTGHKGTFGDALFIAGASSYYGAPWLAAQAFLNAGGGYSRLACPAGMVPTLAGNGSELVFIPQQQTASGSISPANEPDLIRAAETVDIVVIGPGISLDSGTRDLVRSMTAEIDKPLILDGDGITAICDEPAVVRNRPAPTVLTPHLGEMSRLTGKKTGAIQENPVAVLQQTARELDVIIVLKGAHSLIGFPDERVYINLSGNDGMATAGSGDVLTGTIAAMYGLGLSFGKAVRR
ncbi:MAG: bifunctional ADP-dependent NAD(P)H-hydrate dehydratase/NAD(P)H-hydrate epimerase [Deltaproteobacteria bacterium]|nr:MAG: bifunctional ADP-dependent NAD(P)H-hydrate dehydratase/NAD(P)H-hydrate epimerase [Deltaproteobacteria bacterium]